MYPTGLDDTLGTGDKAETQEGFGMILEGSVCTLDPATAAG